MTTRSVPGGSAVSACHTMAGSAPDTSFSVRAMSRSRLMPGNTTTTDFIGGGPSIQRLWVPGGDRLSRGGAGGPSSICMSSTNWSSAFCASCWFGDEDWMRIMTGPANMMAIWTNDDVWPRVTLLSLMTDG